MLANQRQNQIYEIIKSKGNVTVEALINEFNVSIETIRRDLILLENTGNIKRVHGGAVFITTSKRYGKLRERMDENRAKKHEIALLAAELLNEGDIISLDPGSTSIEFVEVIKEKFNALTILTNSLDAVERLQSKENFKIYLTGGLYMPEENAFYGDEAVRMIENFYVPKTFICPSGVTAKNGISDFNDGLTQVERAYIKKADKKIVLADSSKIGNDTFIKICDLNSDFIIITDSGADKQCIKELEDKKINVLRKAEVENDK